MPRARRNNGAKTKSTYQHVLHSKCLVKFKAIIQHSFQYGAKLISLSSIFDCLFFCRVLSQNVLNLKLEFMNLMGK